MPTDRFGWCLIGAGSIAQRVLRDFDKTQGGFAATICSRSHLRAQQLAAACGAVACTELEQAITDPRVQGVYVATPNNLHREHTLLALSLGKPVLCEKPLALNAAQANEMFAAARAARLYLMEGMWTRFQPVIRQVLAWVREGAVGEVRTLRAAFADRVDDPDSRIYSPLLGGGALLDVGVYTISLAQFVFDAMPQLVQATAHLSPAGVDSQCAVTLQYPGGAIAQLFCAVEVETPHDAWICGDRGQIHIPKFWAPEQATLHTAHGAQTIRAAAGFQFEFDAAMDDIRSGRLENALLPHRHSLAVMQLLDTVRRQIGLSFPQEGAPTNNTQA